MTACHGSSTHIVGTELCTFTYCTFTSCKILCDDIIVSICKLDNWSSEESDHFFQDHIAYKNQVSNPVQGFSCDMPICSGILCFLMDLYMRSTKAMAPGLIRSSHCSRLSRKYTREIPHRLSSQCTGVLMEESLPTQQVPFIFVQCWINLTELLSVTWRFGAVSRNGYTFWFLKMYFSISNCLTNQPN